MHFPILVRYLLESRVFEFAPFKERALGYFIPALVQNLFGQAFAQAEAVHSQADVANLARGPITMLAEAAAWSPNPKNPPFFFDLPVKDGKVQPAVAARWVANAPLAIIDQYVSNLRKLHAIAIDVGDKDGLLASNQELSRILAQYDLKNTFEIYDGDHTNHIALRVETKVIPFFSQNLTSDEAPHHK